MDSSSSSSPVQSSSPHSSSAQMSSPTILSSPDSSSPSGMTLLLNALHLSVSQQSKPAPSQADESLFFKSDKTSNSRLSRKYLSYPPNPAPLELHYAAQEMKSKFQLEFSLEETQKLQEQLESGLSQMSTPTLYKGYKAKLASREAFLKPAAAFPPHPSSGLPCIGTREPSEPSDPDLSDESHPDELPEDSDHGSEDSCQAKLSKTKKLPPRGPGGKFLPKSHLDPKNSSSAFTSSASLPLDTPEMNEQQLTPDKEEPEDREVSDREVNKDLREDDKESLPDAPRPNTILLPAFQWDTGVSQTIPRESSTQIVPSVQPPTSTRN
ncbi:uncharacterized protein HD556DRAFT_1436018 [Suillus plorans]|uniref:Uncharacterized protein n=1 Tax=Suillus plorans TaxID=116603 RepID=A0A9P7E3J8_9AGAM|nr:uncharacterized protein HD556DRAFT_1436018 [Suillus plorans]KAG1810295.1 hypothetical protein HD556DRAFT_1436018 [Suillus plorans]